MFGILQPVKVLTPEEKATARWAAFLADPDAWLDQRAAKVPAVMTKPHSQLRWPLLPSGNAQLECPAPSHCSLVSTNSQSA